MCLENKDEKFVFVTHFALAKQFAVFTEISAKRLKVRNCVLQNATFARRRERSPERSTRSKTQREHKNAIRGRSVPRTQSNATRTRNAVQNAVAAAERKTQCSPARKVRNITACVVEEFLVPSGIDDVINLRGMPAPVQEAASDKKSLSVHGGESSCSLLDMLMVPTAGSAARTRTPARTSSELPPSIPIQDGMGEDEELVDWDFVVDDLDARASWEH